MGFVTIEDIQGNIELVLFPKTWDKFRDVLIVGQIVIVEGKVDLANLPPKILVDVIKTEIKVTSAVDAIPEPLPSPTTTLHYKSTNAPAQKATQQPQPTQPKPDVSRIGNPTYAVAESAPEYIAESDMPPPPENFPDNWDNEWQPSFDEVAIASQPAPKFKKDEPITPPLVTRAAEALATAEELVQAEERREAVVQSMYVPLVKENKDKEHPPQQITIMLRPTGDKERDKRRIKTLYGTLISHHGRDKFSFQIFENGNGHLIDFPNDTTRIGPELFERLKKLMGEEGWRVEPIMFQ